MRILITGGLGHIGSYLISSLGAKNCVEKIVVVDNLFTERYTSMFNLQINSVINFKLLNAGDVLLRNCVREESIDLVIHLAAWTNSSKFLNKSEELFANNLESTKNIVNICSELNIPLIFPSSTSVYAPLKNEVNIAEDYSNFNTTNPYSICKIEEETYIASTPGLAYSILRLGTIFGPSVGMSFHTAVNKFCFQAATGQEVTVWKSAKNQVRPYLALNDLSDAIIHILENRIYDNKVYNLVSINATVDEILNIINKFTQTKVNFVQNELMSEISFSVSSSKFEQTGFNFRGNLEKGIKDTLELFKGRLLD
jgi:nucleoside-diphosphate-sugar epimerase